MQAGNRESIPTFIHDFILLVTKERSRDEEKRQMDDGLLASSCEGFLGAMRTMLENVKR